MYIIIYYYLYILIKNSISFKVKCTQVVFLGIKFIFHTKILIYSMLVVYVVITV